MTAIATPPVHRVHAAVTHARETLASVAGERPWSMGPAETAETLAEVEATKAALVELEARLLVHAEAIDLPSESGATSVANWVAHRHKVTRREAHRQVRLAMALDGHESTRTALAEGRVCVEQADAILRGLQTLPEDLAPDLRTRAEEHLLGLAKDFDAKALKNLSRRLLEVVAPDQADEHEAKLLEKEERDAAAATRFSMWEDGHGKVHGRFTLDSLSGAMLKKALFALAAPKHRATTGPLGERKPTPERLGQAFMEYIQRYPANRLPNAGGLDATVVVLMSYESLIGGLKAAKLDTGETISLGLARRLACEAGIIPAVLGGNSEVLDLGRSMRFHSKAQRIVATIEQGGCCVEGCDAPPGMTQMHHPKPWHKAARLTVTPGCSAHPTTDASTTPATPTSYCPTARSACTGGREMRGRRRTSPRSWALARGPFVNGFETRAGNPCPMHAGTSRKTKRGECASTLGAEVPALPAA